MNPLILHEYRGFVLAYRQAAAHPFVVWQRDSAGGFVSGTYVLTVFEAVDVFKERVFQKWGEQI